MLKFPSFLPIDNESGGCKRPQPCSQRLPFSGQRHWLEEGCATRGVFGADFWALISSIRRSVNDPLHLLPSKFGIGLHHWFFFFLLLDEFYNQSQGEKRRHFASLLCQLLSAFKFIRCHFPSLQIWWVEEAHIYETLACYSLDSVWMVNLWNFKNKNRTHRKMNKETTVPSAGSLRKGKWWPGQVQTRR